MLEHITLFFLGLFIVVFLILYYAYYESKKDTKEELPTSPEKPNAIYQEPNVDYRFNEANEYLLNNF